MMLQIDRPTDLHRQFERLFSNLKDDPLTFLTSSGGIVRLIERVSRDDCGVDEAAHMVQREPLIAAKMVAMANSAAYNRNGRIVTTVKDAVSLLGRGMLKSIASAVAVRQLADRAGKGEQAAVSKLWTHSIEVGALASVISRRVTGECPETALFAGLIHEIAGFYLLARGEEIGRLVGVDVVNIIKRDAAAQQQEGHSIMAMAGRRLLTALRVPENVTEAVEGQWRGYLMVPPETLSDTLLIANLMAATPSPFDPDGDKAKQNEFDLDYLLEKTEIASVLQQAHAEIRSIQQVFE